MKSLRITDKDCVMPHNNKQILVLDRIVLNQAIPYIVKVIKVFITLKKNTDLITTYPVSFLNTKLPTIGRIIAPPIDLQGVKEILCRLNIHQGTLVYHLK